MSLKVQYLAPLLITAGATASITGAPVAAADPVWPFGGAEPADQTLQDLEEQGYDVQINWVTGYPTVPLSECWVDAIYNPDGKPSATTLSTVYVNIGCPSNDFD